MQSYEEWAHWLITNIPITSRLVIPGGSSPFLDAKSNENGNSINNQNHHEPNIPGDVIFPYIPPHPALSNPRKNHRYLFLALKQQKKIKIPLDAWKDKAQKRREAINELQRKDVDQPRNDLKDGWSSEMMSVERYTPLFFSYFITLFSLNFFFLSF